MHPSRPPVSSKEQAASFPSSPALQPLCSGPRGTEQLGGAGNLSSSPAGSRSLPGGARCVPPPPTLRCVSRPRPSSEPLHSRSRGLSPALTLLGGSLARPEAGSLQPRLLRESRGSAGVNTPLSRHPGCIPQRSGQPAEPLLKRAGEPRAAELSPAPRPHRGPGEPSLAQDGAAGGGPGEPPSGCREARTLAAVQGAEQGEPLGANAASQPGTGPPSPSGAVPAFSGPRARPPAAPHPSRG